jgi:hypothetical protein
MEVGIQFPLSHDSCRQPQTYVKPEAEITFFELLMMSGVSLETYWTIKKLWNNKFYYTVASCWLFLYESCVGQQYETEYVFCFPGNTFIFLSLRAAKFFKTKYLSWYLL